ncbi:hypothetical protein, partial [Photorhabdus khanii]|uniref:hypothetical protein n=1 Tax=Photorhabdus khanii TaxID=1004150 RepID=UPI001960F579
KSLLSVYVAVTSICGRVHEGVFVTTTTWNEKNKCITIMKAYLYPFQFRQIKPDLNIRALPSYRIL